jgi:uncharacterized protein (DUF983 family)
MAECPSCRHEISVLFDSIRPAIFLQNMFRSPAGKVFICRHCGEQLTMATSGFIACQVAFVVIVIPCAIAFARLHTWLLNSSQAFHELSTEFPNTTLVLLWILPTLIVTLIVCAQFAKRFVEFRRGV